MIEKIIIFNGVKYYELPMFDKNKKIKYFVYVEIRSKR